MGESPYDQPFEVPCGECQEDYAAMTTGEEIYPHRQDLHHLKFWICRECGAYCGSHPDGRPKGHPAGSETRRARMDAHRFFDKLWKDGWMTRTQAYKWLRKELNLSAKEAHIGMMDVERASRVIRVCQEKLRDRNLL